MERGRRIIFDKATGKIYTDTGEAVGDLFPHDEISGLDYIDFPYGYESDNFSKAVKYHIDTDTRTVIFDELIPLPMTYEELQQQLLIVQGVI